MSSASVLTPRLQPEETLMFQEAASASSVIAQQFEANAPLVAAAVERLKAFAPRSIVTCARGSSDHAATYAKYLFETRLGLVTSSAAPSITSIYFAKQQLEGTLYIAISQSGKSPDLLASVEQAKAGGALTLALVNVEDSPLAQMADIVIPLRAGSEKSVAATKSYLATLGAIMHLVSEWGNDEELKAALKNLPQSLAQAWEKDWQSVVDGLKDARNLFVIGRGIGFGAAQEAALKLKETCGLHAEAFSAAEVKHGPMAIVGEGFPVLLFAQQDKTLAGMDSLVEDFRARNAKVFVASESISGSLPVVAGAHPAIAPMLAVQSFYRMANALSIARGYNPDEPPHLRKVTETM
ncbi:SIS domain-containing protein [Cellvibrio sp. ARAG 10.3]|uniref:SIS domain-containing protein n=1 Tax=Cellvibrio sp. ARAG 10.3 TaxID=3451358 RepID=UPI003F47477B